MFPIHPFLTPKIWCFQGVEKECIANKWVKQNLSYWKPKLYHKSSSNVLGISCSNYISLLLKGSSKKLHIKSFSQFLDTKCSNCTGFLLLQSQTKYLAKSKTTRQIYTRPENMNISFWVRLWKTNIWRVDWPLDCAPSQFSYFPIIFYFPEILSLKSLGYSWGNPCTSILYVKCRFA